MSFRNFFKSKDSKQADILTLQQDIAKYDEMIQQYDVLLQFITVYHG